MSFAQYLCHSMSSAQSVTVWPLFILSLMCPVLDCQSLAVSGYLGFIISRNVCSWGSPLFLLVVNCWSLDQVWTTRWWPPPAYTSHAPPAPLSTWVSPLRGPYGERDCLVRIKAGIKHIYGTILFCNILNTGSVLHNVR